MKNISSRENFLKKVYEYSQGIQNYIGIVDYTMLNMDATEEDIKGLCERAKEYGVATVCVRPHMVKLASQELQGSGVGVTTVVGFPEGTYSLDEKVSECKQAIVDGADDIDMVLDYQKLKKFMSESENAEDEGYMSLYLELISEVRELSNICHSAGKILKVIVESSELTPEETKIATEICIKTDADFIKTSTGMIKPGAELNKIKIFYDTIKQNGSNMLIKASGGIRTIEDVKTFATYAARLGIGSGSVDNMMGDGADDSSY